MMYDAEYDRTGKNLGYALNQLASYSNRLAPASLPSWISVPSLDAPIDEERLRFNTSQNTPSTISRRIRTMQRLA